MAILSYYLLSRKIFSLTKKKQPSIVFIEWSFHSFLFLILSILCFFSFICLISCASNLFLLNEPVIFLPFLPFTALNFISSWWIDGTFFFKGKKNPHYTQKKKNKEDVETSKNKIDFISVEFDFRDRVSKVISHWLANRNHIIIFL